MSTTPLLDVRDVRKTFVSRRIGRPTETTNAVDGVSLAVERGETLGIVGESGSGKSTLARVVMGLHRPDAGEVVIDGRSVDMRKRTDMRWLRRQVQMVFQDAYGSLDPNCRIGTSLREPLVVQKVGDRDSQRARVEALMEMVGLGQHLLGRYPAELSGGQLQRVAVARALAVDPRLLVCDEPVSALDVSTQAQVVNLLKDLQDELGIAIVFITHDISVVRNVSHRVAVMHHGRVVETGSTESVLTAPQEDYTRQLMRAVPGRAVASHRDAGQPEQSIPSPGREKNVPA